MVFPLPLMWTYKISPPCLSKDGIVLDRECYSGAFPDGFNDPLTVGEFKVGPIPPGNYTITGPPFNDREHGPYCLRLVPDAATRAYIVSLGRDPDSFLLHGKPEPPRDPRTGSQGCICSSPSQNRSYVYQSGDTALQVIP